MINYFIKILIFHPKKTETKKKELNFSDSTNNVGSTPPALETEIHSNKFDDLKFFSTNRQSERASETFCNWLEHCRVTQFNISNEN